MPTPSETWDAYLVVAEAMGPGSTPPPALSPIAGRYISFLVHKLVIFWGRHKATLTPFLTNLAIAALEALVANETAFQNVNPPGPD